MPVVRIAGTGDAAAPPHAQWMPRLRRWIASRYLEEVHGLHVAPATLAKYATLGGGPCFHRVGRIPLYPVTELDRWAECRLGPLVASTSGNDLRSESPVERRSGLVS